MTTLTPTPKQQFLDANGNPLSGGKVYTYAAGTTTPLTTYTDEGGSTPNTNPVILDSRGEAAIWLGVASYKLKLTTATDVEIWTVDNIVSASVQALADLSESGGSALVGYLPAGTGAVATTVQAKLRQTVSVKDFGAVGDGIADDTTAIQAANNSGASGIVFPYGTYKATQLTMTVNWDMEEGAEMLFSGTIGQTLVTCSGSNLRGNLNLSGGDLAPRTLLLLSGSNNRFRTVRVTKIKSPVGSGINTGVDITGNSNTIDAIVATDLNNTGNTNDSIPQALVTSSTSDKNIVGMFSANDVTSGITMASSGKLTVGSVQIVDATDNGLYALSGHLDVEAFEYAGSDEPIVSSGSSVSIGTATITKAGNAAIGVQNSGDIKIGMLILKNEGIAQILKTRTGNTASGQIFIGSIIGEFTGNSLISCTVGTIDFLSIPLMDVQYNWASAVSGALSQWCRLDGCKGFNIGLWNIRVIDTSGDTVSGQFEFVAPTTSLAKISFARDIDVVIYQSDKVTLSSSGDMRMFNFAQSLIRTSGIRWQVNIGPYGKTVTYGQPNTTNAIPTTGTWQVGERLFRNPPVVGQPKSWVCTVAGTPGTWVSEGNL